MGQSRPDVVAQGSVAGAPPATELLVGRYLLHMLENVPAAAYTCDADGLITSFNLRAVELWGKTPRLHDPVDRFCASVRHFLPNGSALAPAESWTALALQTGQELHSREIIVERPDGRRSTVLAHANPIRNDSGQVIGVLNVLVDITDRKHAEIVSRFLADAGAALADATDFENAMQRVASLAVPAFADVCVVDILELDGSIRRIAAAHADPRNRELAAALHHPNVLTDSAEPNTVAEVIRLGIPKWGAGVSDAVLRSIVRDEARRQTLHDLRMRSYICVPLRSRGRSLGALTLVTGESGRTFDRSDVRAAEELAHRATIAVENATLLQALADADRRKNEFLATLAHELRNPLAPIQNAVHILRTAPAEEHHWAIDVIGRQVQQMARLVDDLMDVSRITRGKVELSKERVELAAVVRNALESSRPLVERSGHQLNVQMPPSPVILDADFVRLSQVLTNLLNNAAKFTPPGGRIDLIAECDGGEVAVHVRDNGIGIAPRMLPTIFEPFMQIEGAPARAQSGLGIGLTLVRQLVQLHGGKVEAHSAGVGKGSDFVVRLPVAAETAAAAAQSNAVGAPAEPPCRMLVVDDNQDTARTMSMLLQMIGYEVRTAYDGLQAVQVASEFRPDVVMLDIGLPGIDGFESARRIRAGWGRGVVLIALTGLAQDSDRRASQEAGFDYHLVKPVKVFDVHGLLQRHPGMRRCTPLTEPA